MKHLHFVQSLEPLQGAGLGQAALSLHLALLKLYPASSSLLSTKNTGFESHWPGVIQGNRKGPWKLFYAPELRDLARDVVDQAEWFHGHGLYVWTNYWLGKESRRRGKPLIYHPHGFFDPWILRRSKGKKRIAQLLFEDQNIDNVRWWRALSSKEADQIRSVVGDKAEIHIIPNGIDSTDIDFKDPFTSDQCAWAIRKRPKRVLFLSRIHPKKGLDLLVDVWIQLTKEFPDWELLIAGPDEGGYQSTVETLLRTRGGCDSCWIHPAVSGSEKHALLQSADLFVLPSYSEGFPLAVLEAAAHGLPVVQTTECNFPELAAAGGAWQCLPLRDDLEQALRSGMATDDKERIERGQRGRSLVVRKYSWNTIAQTLNQLCQ